MTKVLDAATLDLKGIVRPGDHVIWGQATGEPLTLTEALAAQRHEVGPVSAFLGATFSQTFQPEHADRIAFSGFGAIGTLRRLAKAGVLGLIPCHVSQIGPYIEAGLIGADVAFVQLSPVGPDGRHSFGVINDFVQTAIAKARVVVAEINDQVPWTHGNGGLDPARLDFAIQSSRPVVAVPSGTPGEQDRAIAGHVAAFIEDGAVLQFGIGAVPDAILQLLADRRDLGVHSGMIGDGLVDLVEKGVVTNRTKTLHPGVSVTGALIGTEKLYRFADRNPAVAVMPATITHGDAALSQLAKLVTINSAVEVDLTGQVNAEQVGADYVGGVGGQADYVRAGHRSPGGHAVIALPSSAKNGEISRIVPRLSGPVTTPRTDVDIVVTEHGAADLRGRTLPERARRMIAIAHPGQRDALEQAATDLFRRGF